MAGRLIDNTNVAMAHSGEYQYTWEGIVPELIGYARVNTSDKSTDEQIKKLKVAGCSKIFSEVISGVAKLKERPQFGELLQQLQPGDTVVVCSVVELSRDMLDIIGLKKELDEKQIGIRSLREGETFDC